MNQISDDKITALASAFADRMTVRKTAAACDVSRDTVLRYFRHFNGDEPMRVAAPPREHSEPVDYFAMLARDILSPDIVSRIDARLRELEEQHEALKLIQRVAARIHPAI